MNFFSEWKPRRTIIFASWDAEEYGVTGSLEWLEVIMYNNCIVHLWKKSDVLSYIIFSRYLSRGE